MRRLFWNDRRTGIRLVGRGRNVDADCARFAGGTFSGSADAAMSTATIRVELASHLRGLARIQGPVELEVAVPVTPRTVLDALEARYPALRGAVREHVTQERRPFLRFFANGEDLSHQGMDVVLPEAVTAGTEPLLIIGA